MIVVFCFVLILCICAVGSLEIQLLNKEVIENDVFGSPLQVALIEDGRRVYNAACVVVDGKVCQCYSSVDQIVWSQACSVFDWKSMWFSIAMPVDGNTIISLPLFIQRANASAVLESHREELLTLVLPVILDDLSRVAILFDSLRQIEANVVSEVLVFVPDYQKEIMTTVLVALANTTFTVNVISEDTLFSRKLFKANTYNYAVQMAIKLLCARLVRTRFYLTLDADVVLLQPFTPATLNRILIRSGGSVRAIFENENKTVHPDWWTGSQILLGIDSDNPAQSRYEGLGVTPVVLSTYGSLLTINALTEILADCGVAMSAEGTQDAQCNQSLVEERWLDTFGKSSIWSEYTLYRVVLDQLGIFDELHVLQSSDFQLHCGEVWYAEQLPWIVTEHMKQHCLFSLVQSSSKAYPHQVYRELISNR